jgi:hypothetical protein
LPPRRQPLLLGRRMRKRWRYVGVYCEEFLLCAARAQVGPAWQTFWAIVDRAGGELLERTRKLPPGARGEVWSVGPDERPWSLGDERPGVVTRIAAAELTATLQIGSGRWVESVCPNGEGGFVWTRKRIAPVQCRIRLADGRRFEGEAFGIEDESAGYHPRHTRWLWSAGVGTAADGRAVGWNLVSGINDPPTGSERAIWVDGEPFEPGPVRFDGLEGIDFDEGSRLRFAPEAERRAEENLLAIRFSYRQPFGSFTGSLPGGIELAAALGVMESHDALW